MRVVKTYLSQIIKQQWDHRVQKILLSQHPSRPCLIVEGHDTIGVHPDKFGGEKINVDSWQAYGMFSFWSISRTRWGRMSIGGKASCEIYVGVAQAINALGHWLFIGVVLPRGF